MLKDFFNRIRTYFITGLVVVLPAFITIVILKWLIGKINVWFLEPIVRLARPYADSSLMIFLLKLGLFFALLIIVIACGAATRVILLRRFFGWGERLLTKAPVVSKIYVSIKEVSSALFDNKKGLFKKVVLVEYPRKEVFAIGFVTCEHINKKAIATSIDDDLASVFVPTAPNPTSGVFIFVKKKDLIDVDMDVEEAFKLILSGGAILPPDENPLKIR
jgi:uncharacterized membrane protein